MKRKSLMIFSLAVLGLFMFSSMVPMVSAYSWNQFGSDILNAIKGFDTTSQTASIFAKILMVFIVTALVYTVLDFLKIFPEKEGSTKYDWIKWVVSAGVGILSFLFVKIDMISDLVRQYEALGVTLTVVLPAIIVIVFAFKLKAKALEGDESGGFVQRIISNVILFVYWIYMISVIWGEGNVGPGIIRGLYIVIMVAILLVLLVGNRIVKFYSQRELDDAVGVESEKSRKELVSSLIADTDILREKWANAKTPQVRGSLAGLFDRKIKSLRELKVPNRDLPRPINK